jgi:hypothetical protein
VGEKKRKGELEKEKRRKREEGGGQKKGEGVRV